MRDFITRFQTFVTENALFAKGEPVLLAVSGGVDSVVLCHLFQQSDYPFGIAHCNFQLRGEASDGDEAFVKDFARQLEVPFFSTSFDTTGFAEAHKISIQMAARELRYTWLEKIRQEHDFQWIATAHHRSDSIETFFYNFTKGTGIQGLQGIPMRNERIVRPLLFATKAEIAAVAKTENIAYREDATNEETKYTRNKIRHLIIPVLVELNPHFEQIAIENLQRLREAAYLYHFAIGQIRHAVVTEEDGKSWINIAKLLEHQPAATALLYEWLKPFGFRAHQVRQMLEASVGAIFYTPTHRLLIDRANFIIEKRTFDITEEPFVIPAGVTEFDINVGKLTFEHKTGRPESFPNDPFVVYLDAEKMSFPLTLRHWQPGDFFYPLGLSGNRQKLQDFFTNQKLSRFEKDNVWILSSGDAICWIVGHRIDERCKITNDTKSYWVIHFKKS